MNKCNSMNKTGKYCSLKKGHKGDHLSKTHDCQWNNSEEYKMFVPLLKRNKAQTMGKDVAFWIVDVLECLNLAYEKLKKQKKIISKFRSNTDERIRTARKEVYNNCLEVIKECFGDVKKK